MEITIFENQTWQEIPEQENPAMFYVNRSRPEECVMIFKGRYDRITAGGFVVALVPIEGDIIKQGVFWRLETAVLFAKALKGGE